MYKRVIRLEARLEVDGEIEKDPFLILDELRITFDISMGFAQALAESRVTIYNLSVVDSMSLLVAQNEATDKGEGEDNKLSKRVNILLYAGHKDELTEDGRPQLLLDGWVMNGAATKMIPEHVTELYILPKSAALLAESFKPIHTMDGGRKHAESDTLEEALKRVCIAATYDEAGIKFFLDDTTKAMKTGNLTLKPDKDSGVHGTLRQLQKTFSFTFIGTAVGISFYPKLETSDAGISAYHHLIKEGGDEELKATSIIPTRLRGTPITGMLDIQIPYMLSPELSPGFVIDTTVIQGKVDKTEDGGDKGNSTTEDGQGLNVITGLGNVLFYDNSLSKYAILDTYVIETIQHVGDNYGEDWHSTIIGNVPVAGRYQQSRR